MKVYSKKIRKVKYSLIILSQQPISLIKICKTLD